MPLFTRLKQEVPFDGAQYVDESKVRKILTVSIPLQDGYVNWLFGPDAASLKSQDGAYTLTEANGAVSKTYGANVVNLGADAGTNLNGLRSPFVDSNNYTICGVFKYSGDPAMVLMGAIDGTKGESIQMNSSGVLAHSRRNSSGVIAATPVPLPPGLKAGDYIFIALTRNGDNFIAKVGGATTTLAATSAKAVGTGLFHGPGNTSTPTAGYSKALTVAEFLYKPSAATDAELEQVYQLSKTRCAARGITIL
ncbi:hypothetical protein [Mixta calida]|uniref:hypothetical protein n=1 Tax=Mixta calida TaxID=665913 RepID=UPI00403A9A16